VALFDWRRNSYKLLFIFLSIFITIILYSISQVPVLLEFFPFNLSILRSFQWSRFFVLYPLFLFLAWMILFSSTKSIFIKRTLIFGLLFQIFVNFFQHPQVNSLLVSDSTKKSLLVNFKRISFVYNTLTIWVPKDFDAYYAWGDYALIKERVKDNAVLSLDLDPMKAAMSSIRTVDGYYSLYPLDYKYRFRRIIENSLELSGRKKYYDNWGSRIYIFYHNHHVDQINFCKAYDLGAKFVISPTEILSESLFYEVKTHGSFPLYLYRIKNFECLGY
jgi:hypothetical protein